MVWEETPGGLAQSKSQWVSKPAAGLFSVRAKMLNFGKNLIKKASGNSRNQPAYKDTDRYGGGKYALGSVCCLISVGASTVWVGYRRRGRIQVRVEPQRIVRSGSESRAVAAEAMRSVGVRDCSSPCKDTTVSTGFPCFSVA